MTNFPPRNIIIVYSRWATSTLEQIIKHRETGASLVGIRNVDAHLYEMRADSAPRKKM